MKYEIQGEPMPEPIIQVCKELERSNFSGALLLQLKKQGDWSASKAFLCFDLKTQRKMIQEIKEIQAQLKTHWFRFSEKADNNWIINSLERWHEISIIFLAMEEKKKGKEGQSKESPKGQRTASIVSKHEEEPPVFEEESTTLLPILSKHAKTQ